MTDYARKIPYTHSYQFESNSYFLQWKNQSQNSVGSPLSGIATLASPLLGEYTCENLEIGLYAKTT